MDAETAFRTTAKACMLHPTEYPLEAFLLSYKSYGSSGELVEIWTEELSKSGKDKKGPATQARQLALLEFLRAWLRQYYSDFSRFQRAAVLAKIREQIGTPIENEFKLIFVQESKKDAIIASQTSPKRTNGDSGIPYGATDGPNGGPQFKRIIEAFKMTTFQVSNTSAYVVAKQLTLRDIERFKTISPREFLDQSWQNQDKNFASPYLTENIDKFNEVSYWVCTAILCEKTTPRQSHLLRKFIKVAYKCLLWNNFNGIMQILSGLGNTSISRLKDPWNNLPSHTKAKFQKLELLMAPQQNYKCYRERFRETPYPKLPYLAVILRDITFVNVGNAKYRADGMLNLDRLVLLREQICEVARMQAECNGGYEKIFGKASEEKNKMLDYFAHLPRVEDDEFLYELSQQYQPARSPHSPSAPGREDSRTRSNTDSHRIGSIVPWLADDETRARSTSEPHASPLAPRSHHSKTTSNNTTPVGSPKLKRSESRRKAKKDKMEKIASDSAQDKGATVVETDRRKSSQTGEEGSIVGKKVKPRQRSLSSPYTDTIDLKGQDETEGSNSSSISPKYQEKNKLP